MGGGGGGGGGGEDNSDSKTLKLKSTSFQSMLTYLAASLYATDI